MSHIYNYFVTVTKQYFITTKLFKWKPEENTAESKRWPWLWWKFKVTYSTFWGVPSEVCHPRCVFKLYGEVNSVEKHNYKIWLNDGVY